MNSSNPKWETSIGLQLLQYSKVQADFELKLI